MNVDHYLGKLADGEWDEILKRALGKAHALGEVPPEHIKPSPLEEMNAIMARMFELVQEAQSRLDRPARRLSARNPFSCNPQTEAAQEWVQDVRALSRMVRDITPEQAKEVNAKWFADKFSKIGEGEWDIFHKAATYPAEAISLAQDALKWRESQGKIRETEKRIAEATAIIEELKAGAISRQDMIEETQDAMEVIERKLREQPSRIKLLQWDDSDFRRDSDGYHVAFLDGKSKWQAVFDDGSPDSPVTLGTFDHVRGAIDACNLHHRECINLILTQPLELAPEAPSLFEQEPQEERE